MAEKKQLIRNAWYVAAWGSEVGETPYAVQIAGDHIVIYRKSDGTPVALDDTCPHRFAPLHRGKVRGDRIECGYHGLQFDETGACVHNPVGEGTVPRSACLRRYPLVERDTLLWIWMGDSEHADPARIPDFDWLNKRNEFAMTAERSMRQDIAYELIVDNLLDLSHGAFLHPTTLGNPEMANGTANVRQEGDRLFYDRWNPNGTVPQLFVVADAVEAGARIDFWNDMRWDAPGNFYLEVGVTRPGAQRGEGAFFGSVHLLTPVNETQTIYRWMLFRNFAKEQPQISKALEDLVEYAFTQEDEPMLKAVQTRMAGRDFWEMKPLLLPADKAAVIARRTLSRLVAEEGDTRSVA